jgi:hypothetical protein
MREDGDLAATSFPAYLYRKNVQIKRGETMTSSADPLPFAVGGTLLFRYEFHRIPVHGEQDSPEWFCA